MNKFTANVCKQVVDFLTPVVRNFDVPVVNDVFNNLSLIVQNDADDADALQELSVFVAIFYDVIVDLLSPEPDAYAWELIHNVNVEIGDLYAYHWLVASLSGATRKTAEDANGRVCCRPSKIFSNKC